jgi:hypothetical protein
MSKFDYLRPAELFTVTTLGRRRRMAFRRFESAALAVGFAIEEIPAKSLIGAILEVEDERLDHRAIRRLYDDPEYPLSRKMTAA